MAHFAELDSNNVVLRVVVISNEDVDANGGDYSTEAETFVSGLVPHSENGVAWKQTSYNGNSRKQYAGIGCTFDSTKNKFISPQPQPSWSLDENDDWQAPVPYPTITELEGYDGLVISWDEDNLTWIGEAYDDSTWNPEEGTPPTITDYTWDRDWETMSYE